MLNIDHLSYSSISSFLTCGKAWKYRYIDKVQAPTSLSLVIGSAVHDVVEEIVRCQSLSVERPETAELAKAKAQERFETAVLSAEDAEKIDEVKNEVTRLVTAPLI